MIGNVEPTFQVGPAADDNRTADEAIELAKVAGVELLDWQAAQVRRTLGQTKDQEWSSTRVGLAVPRQNGKGTVLEVVVLAKAVLLGERVLWTAHEVRTMQESFARFRALLDATPELSRLVASIRAANGQERVLFTNGAEVKFSARSKSAARGLGFRTLIFDEAQELEYLTLGAMVPTLSGQRDERTQQIMTGTPPYSRKGEVWADMRAAAHAGSDTSLSWSEWAADKDDRIDDEEVWARTNPSLGSIVRVEKIKDELAAMEARPDVFRRERLGEWGRSGDNAAALDEAAWSAGALPIDEWPDDNEGHLYDVKGFGPTPVAFVGVDGSFGADMVTTVRAHALAGDRIGLEVLEAAPGLDWLQEHVTDIREEYPRLVFAFDPLRVGDVSPDLAAAGLRDVNGTHNTQRIVSVSSRDLTLACDALVRAVREGRIVHDDPRLDVAAAGATRSTFKDGTGWKFAGIDGADVHVLVAAALAVRVLLLWKPKRAGGGGKIIVFD